MRSSFILSLSLVLLVVCLLDSCQKNPLSITPANELSDATVFNDTATAYLFLNAIYNDVKAGPLSSTFTLLPTEVSNDPLDDFTDNATYGPASGTLSSTLFDNDS